MAKKKRLPRYETCFYRRKSILFLKFFNRSKESSKPLTYEFIFLDPHESFTYHISQGNDCNWETYSILQTCFEYALGKWTVTGLHQISNDTIPVIVSELRKRVSQLENLKSWHELAAYFDEHNFTHAISPLYATYRNLRRNPKKLIIKINQFISKVIALLEINYRAGKTFWLSGL